MKMAVFEGTVEEIRDVARTVFPMSTGLTLVEISEEASADEDLQSKIWSQNAEQPKKFVTGTFARRVLTRQPALSEPFKAVLRALHGAYPNWVLLSDLQHVASYTPQQFAGLMGAFGKRMSHTDNYDEDAHFFDFRWNDEKEEYEYRLPDTVCEVLNPDDD